MTSGGSTFSPARVASARASSHPCAVARRAILLLLSLIAVTLGTAAPVSAAAAPEAIVDATPDVALPAGPAAGNALSLPVRVAPIIVPPVRVAPPAPAEVDSSVEPPRLHAADRLLRLRSLGSSDP